jgi:excinuclease UvrABC helicase subunit UvrB
VALERNRPEEAVDALRDGIERLMTHQHTWWDEHEPADSPNLALVDQLRLYEKEIRKKFGLEKTLRDQLDEAVAKEDYERAAALRDQIRAQKRARR